jgi:3-methyl-2-oxobutanoate hydroxymethyltransferase
MSAQSHSNRVTVTTLRKMKQASEKIASLTAYDASFAAVLDAAGVDIILVGDSLGMVIQGHDTTVPVTVEDVIYHTRAVASRTHRALLIADMPFMSYTTTQQALDTARRLMQEGGAQMVKLEGGVKEVETVRKLSEQGVPVCAHLGLQPQLVHKLGGYRVQGREQAAAQKMLEEAQALEEAGADLLVLECVPASLAARITQSLNIPTIGIGASAECDGQILVLQDVLGITPGRVPKFAKNFLKANGSIQGAVDAYIVEVRRGTFPAAEHLFSD